MFFLAEIADTLRVPPTDFGCGDAASLVKCIKEKYSAEVLMDVGMVVKLYDVIRVGSSIIHPSDGGAHFEVVFRLVIFKPLVGEVLKGKVTHCSKDGIKVSFDFINE